MLVKLGDEAAQQRALRGLGLLIGQLLRVADQSRCCCLDCARHGCCLHRARYCSNGARTPLKRLLSFFRRGVIYWLPLTLLLTTALAHLVLPEEFDQLSALAAYDVHQRIAPRESPPDVPVLIVDIDESS